MSSVYGRLDSRLQGYYAPEMFHEQRNWSPVFVVGIACVASFIATYSVISSSSLVFSRSAIPVARPIQVQGLAPLSVAPSATHVRVQVVPQASASTAEGDVIISAEPKANKFSLHWILAAVFSMSIVPMIQLYKRWSMDVDEDEDEEMAEMEEEASWALAATVGQVRLQHTAVVPIKDASGSAVGTAELCLKTAGVNSRHVIHRKLVAEMANRRQSNAHTKTRAEVSGGGKKPYKQKGTGNARRGSTRSPLMRHGGVAFGPRNTKNYKQKINKKEGRLAISSLIQNRAPLITVIKDMENCMNVISTKKAAAMVESWKEKDKGNNVLLVIDAPGEWPETHPLVMSTNNLPLVRLMSQQKLCVTDLLWPHQIFVSEKAMEALKLRFEVPEVSEESDAAVV